MGGKAVWVGRRALDDLTHGVHGFRWILLEEMHSAQLCAASGQGTIWCKSLHTEICTFTVKYIECTNSVHKHA